MDMEAEILELKRQIAGIPSRWAGGGTSSAAPVYPWVQLLTKGGQTLIAGPPAVYGVKRKVGEAKAGHWIYMPEQATATCALGSGANAGKVVSTTLTNSGKGYTSNPSVTVSAPPSGGTQAVITAAYSDGGYVEGVYITGGGSLYGVAGAAVTFSPPPSGTTATGVTRVRNGKVVGITITNAGSGYVTAPTVTCPASDGGGTLATAACVLGRGKVALTITNAGAGYVTAPTLTIAAPPQEPYPTPPWADGVGWGVIQGGSLTGGLAAGTLGLICHDDRSLVAYGLIGDGGSSSVPYSRPPDATLSWYLTYIKLSIADADADGVLPAWVPMACGI